MQKRLATAFFGCLVAAAALVTPGAVAATTLVRCGAGTDLQTAIDAAAPGDTLIVKGMCIGTFMIDKDLTLSGAPRATLDARGAGTTLTILPALGRLPTVTISGLAITGGNPSGIDATGYLTIQSSTVRGNAGDGVRHDGEFDGAFSAGTLTLLDSSVTGNSGDGVFATHSRTSIQNSIVSRNGSNGLNFDISSADVYGSTVSNNGANGVLPQMQTGITMRYSTITGNAGTGISESNAAVFVEDSTISNNLSGGIDASELAYLEVHRSRITGNVADFGGGIHLEPRLVDRGAVVEDSIIKANTARISGGGIYIDGVNHGDAFARLEITNNTAGTSGGGIFDNRTTSLALTLTDVILRNDTPDDCFGC
jgi:nitrous oxidase accessory protein NosD